MDVFSDLLVKNWIKHKTKYIEVTPQNRLQPVIIKHMSQQQLKGYSTVEQASACYKQTHIKETT